MALVEAMAIGLVLLVVGVPLVLPLALLVFIGAFVPLVGAFVAGSAAVLVALASDGLTAALIVAGAAVVIQQLEGDLIHPVVVARAVKLHPIAVLLAVTAGAVVWGVPGAFLGFRWRQLRTRPAATSARATTPAERSSLTSLGRSSANPEHFGGEP